MEKKYHPSLEWNDEEGLLQDPKTHAPHSNMDFKVSLFFVSLLGIFLFSCSIESLMLRHCHFVVVCSCWNFGHYRVDHVVILALGNFLNCWVFLAWCNLDNVDDPWNLGNACNMWCCWMNFGLTLRGTVVMENLLYRLDRTNTWWVRKICWHV